LSIEWLTTPLRDFQELSLDDVLHVDELIKLSVAGGT
jgi:hypothetical protein